MKPSNATERDLYGCVSEIAIPAISVRNGPITVENSATNAAAVDTANKIVRHIEWLGWSLLAVNQGRRPTKTMSKTVIPGKNWASNRCIGRNQLQNARLAGAIRIESTSPL